MPKKVSVTKKAVTKKAVKKDTAKRSLVYASNKTSFWVNDGRILNNLKALEDAFSSMNAETFKHHVTKEKNDFANWVDAVLGDSVCANSLFKAKTPKTAKTAVTKCLKNYSL